MSLSHLVSQLNFTSFLLGLLLCSVYKTSINISSSLRNGKVEYSTVMISCVLRFYLHKLLLQVNWAFTWQLVVESLVSFGSVTFKKVFSELQNGQISWRIGLCPYSYPWSLSLGQYISGYACQLLNMAIWLSILVLPLTNASYRTRYLNCNHSLLWLTIIYRYLGLKWRLSKIICVRA